MGGIVSLLGLFTPPPHPPQCCGQWDSAVQCKNVTAQHCPTAIGWMWNYYGRD